MNFHGIRDVPAAQRPAASRLVNSLIMARDAGDDDARRRARSLAVAALVELEQARDAYWDQGDNEPRRPMRMIAIGRYRILEVAIRHAKAAIAEVTT